MPGFASSLGQGAAVSGLAASSTLLGGMCGRAIHGFLIDKIGSVRATMIMCTLSCIGGIFIVTHPSTALFLAGGFMFGLAFGLSLVQSVIAVRQNTGMKSFSIINGWNNAVMALGYYTAIPLYSYVFDVTGSYVNGAYMFFSALVLAVVFVYTAKKAGEKYQKEWTV
jgi:MFS family permease